MDHATEPAPTSAEGRVTWVRHPADVARMVVAALVWVIVAGLAMIWPDDARSLSTRVVLAVGGLPRPVSGAIVGLVQVAAVVAPLAALLLVRRGRWRELGLAAGAAAATAAVGIVLDGRLVAGLPATVIEEGQRPSWVTGSAFPSGAYLAAAAAAVTVLASGVARPWRRVLWGAVGVVAVARVLTAVETPVGIVSCVAAGVFVGSLVMVVARAPLRWPPATVVRDVLRHAGLAVLEVEAAGSDRRHGPSYRATVEHGPDLFVKVVGRDERDAELLARTVRAIRVDAPDDRRSVGAAETIDHEAACLALAARAGVNVPALVTVAQTEERAAVLVMEAMPGRRLDEIGELDDGLLAAAFDQLARLHRARLAHGWASLHHLVALEGGGVGVLDLRWATPSASDEQLAADLADLLVSAAAIAGIERAVTAATAAFDADALARALPLIQPLAVSPESRAAARRTKGLLGDLRAAVQVAAGVEAFEMAKIERLSLRKVVMFAGTLVMALVLLFLIGNIGEIWDAMREMDPWYLVPLTLVGLLGFPAGAISLMGAVRVRLGLARTTEMMFAQSFLNRFTPANAGGMALRVRYLQRHGVELVTAASAVAITSAASGVMQVVLALTFLTWAGRDDEASTFSLPSGQVIAIAAVAIGVVVGVAYATTKGRALLLKTWESLRSALADLRALARQPAKLAMLLGGAGLSKLSSIVALAVTMAAFGVPVDLPAVGAMYIIATTVAGAAPTPGGVGPIEAALTAGLIGLGVDPGQAAAIVLVFRLFTYWFPTLPSWWAMDRMQRRGDL